MLGITKCDKRNCVHYEGIKQSEEGNERTEFNYCLAFPNGIPYGIAYGDNNHDKPLPEQDNDIVYEKE